MFAINIDIDWAPDSVIESALDILDEFGARATLFCTHEMGASARGREVCVHPNFTAGQPDKDVLDSVCSLFPGARGVRGHGSLFSYYIAGLYREKGLLFDSSYFYPAGPCKPYRMFHGLLEIPYFFIDDLFFKEDGLREPDLSDTTDSVKVFVFHPVHIFLNTETPERYEKAKPYYKMPEELAAHRNPGAGAGTFFRKLLGHANEMNIPLLTMSEVYDRFSEK
ncbi:MAG: hypothetical protein WCX65_14130 [bacterium]